MYQPHGGGGGGGSSSNYPTSSRPSGAGQFVHHQQQQQQQQQPPVQPIMSHHGPRSSYTPHVQPQDPYPTFMQPSHQPVGGPSSMPEPSPLQHDPRFSRASTASPPPNASGPSQRHSFFRTNSQGIAQQALVNQPRPSRPSDPRLRPQSGTTMASNYRPNMPALVHSAPTVPLVNVNPGRSGQQPPPQNTMPQYPQSPTQGEHSSPSHNMDDCPGCQADLQAAIRASEASARQEIEQREQREREEEEHWRAMRASEEEAQRRREAEEEELRLVMAASQRDEEEAQKRRLEKQREEEAHRQVLLEESRQSALREDEERIKRAHAELLERSRREAEESVLRRRQEEERLQAVEAAIVEESRREMEEEWRRREEEELAMEEFARQGGKQGEAAYWQHLHQNQAYDLAVRMNQNLSISRGEASGSSRATRRPLPPTPGLAALAAGVESPSPNAAEQDESHWDHPEDATQGDLSDDDDPFGDEAEAPPSYDEVRTDRPPEVPQLIPDHIRFATPEPVVESGPSNTLAVPILRSEKTPVSPDLTPRPPLRELPSDGQQVVTSTSCDADRPITPVSLAVLASPLPEPNSAAPAIPSPSSVDPGPELSRTQSQSSTAASVETTDESSRRLSTSTVHSEDASRMSLQQRAMKGTDFGYCNEPFSPDLVLDEEKKYFPSVIRLKGIGSDGSLREPRAYYVIQAPSWKMLLRALAWYGNTRIEAGPEEVADSSKALKMRLELEFVTPSKVDASLASRQQETWKNAHVSLCISLLSPQVSPDGALTASLKRSSRALDSSYLRIGSTRRVLTLPSQAPRLPMVVVRLAQLLHQAHVFSAACPSTSSTALHSPRDLTRAIDRHDVSYVAKLQRLRRDAEAAVEAENPSGPSRPRPAKVGSSGDGGGDDDGIDDHDALDAGAVGMIEDAEISASTMSRMKARMKRKLAKRSGESNAVDQDLESWISE